MSVKQLLLDEHPLFAACQNNSITLTLILLYCVMASRCRYSRRFCMLLLCQLSKTLFTKVNCSTWKFYAAFKIGS